MSSCTSCGHQLGVGRFCTNCGAPVDSSTPDGTPVSTPVTDGDWRTDTAERRLSAGRGRPAHAAGGRGAAPAAPLPAVRRRGRGLLAVRPAHHDRPPSRPPSRQRAAAAPEPASRPSRSTRLRAVRATTTTRSAAARCSGSSRPRWCWCWSRPAGGSWSATTAPTRPPRTAAAASRPRNPGPSSTDGVDVAGRASAKAPEDRAAQRGRQRRPGLLRRQQHARRRPRHRLAGARRRHRHEAHLHAARADRAAPGRAGQRLRQDLDRRQGPHLRLVPRQPPHPGRRLGLRRREQGPPAAHRDPRAADGRRPRRRDREGGAQARRRSRRRARATPPATSPRSARCRSWGTPEA